MPAALLLAVAVAIVVAILRWAAVVRAGVHHHYVRRAKGFHLTLSAVAGCGLA
jgi:hypothetical protein